MRSPRLAFVCADPGVPIFGTKGCSIHAQEILRGFLRRGWTVDLAAYRPGGSPPPDLAEVRILPLPSVSSADPGDRELGLLRANDTLRDLLAASNAYDLVYERHALFAHAGMEFAADRGIPGVLEVNAPLVEEQSRHRELVHLDEAVGRARRAFAAATALVAVSDEVAEYLRSRTHGPNRIHVIPNGVDPARFPEPTAVDGAGSRPFTVGFVGTLKAWHGLDILADAFARVLARLPEARLLVVGDGPERAAFLRRLEHLGASHAVRFTGAVSPDVIPNLLGSIDVATAPYPSLGDFYFSPLKVYEYMAARRATVASGIGQLRSLIVDGANGLLCRPGDPNALADAILRLHDDPGLRDRLGRAARETILAAHTWDHVVDRTLAAAGVRRELARAA